MTDDPQAGTSGPEAGAPPPDTGAAPPAGGPPPPADAGGGAFGASGDGGASNRTTQIVIGVVVALAIALLGAWALGFGPFARPAVSPSPGATLAPATAAPTAEVT